MTWTSGNLERDHLLRNAVAAYGADKEAIRASLPGDFDAGDDEITAVLAEFEQPSNEVTFEPVPGTVVVPPDLPFSRISGLTLAPAPKSPAAAPSAVDVPQATMPRPKNRAEAVAELRDADMALAECRRQVRITTAAVLDAKGRLQKEIEKHVAVNPNRLTPEMQARQYAQASLEARRQRALKYGTGESASARRFVQKRMTGGGPNRGALNQEQRARLGFAVPGSPAAMAPFDHQADQRARQGLSQAGKPVLPSK